MGNQKLHVEEWTIQDGRQNEIKKQNKQTMAKCFTTQKIQD